MEMITIVVLRRIMKKVSAFILTLIYLAFTAGIASDAPFSEAASYAAAWSADNSVSDAEKNTVEKDSPAVKVNTHHTAAAGKIKMPRTGITTHRIVCYSPISSTHYAVKHFTISTYAVPPADLYIRHCVFLI